MIIGNYEITFGHRKAKRFSVRDYVKMRNAIAEASKCTWTVRDTVFEGEDYYNNWSR